jgi:hypothetical protein
MNTDVEIRRNRRELEEWPELPEDAQLPVPVTSPGPVESSRMPELYASFAQLVARLLAEVAEARKELAEAQVPDHQERQSSSLRERMLQGQVDELTTKIRSLTSEVATLQSAAQQKDLERRARELRNRLRTFSD